MHGGQLLAVDQEPVAFGSGEVSQLGGCRRRVDQQHPNLVAERVEHLQQGRELRSPEAPTPSMIRSRRSRTASAVS